MNALASTIVSAPTFAKDAFPAPMSSLLLVSAAAMASRKEKDPGGSDAAYPMSSPDEAAASMILSLPRSYGEARPSNDLSSSTSSLPAPLSAPNPPSTTGILDDRASKRQQRLMKNRQSAALSRQRKKEYITDLETRAHALTTEKLEMQVGITKLAIQSLEAHQHLDFMVRSLRDIRAENEILKQRLAMRETFKKGECTQEEYDESVMKSGVVPAVPILLSVPPSPIGVLPQVRMLDTVTSAPLPTSGAPLGTPPSTPSVATAQQNLIGASSSSMPTSHSASSEPTKPAAASLRTASHVPATGVASTLSSPPSFPSSRPAGSTALPPSNFKPPARRPPEMIVNILDRPEIEAPPLQRRRPPSPPPSFSPFAPPPPQRHPLPSTS